MLQALSHVSTAGSVLQSSLPSTTPRPPPTLFLPLRARPWTGAAQHALASLQLPLYRLLLPQLDAHWPLPSSHQVAVIPIDGDHPLGPVLWQTYSTLQP
jgi:hypothetical protein